MRVSRPAMCHLLKTSMLSSCPALAQSTKSEPNFAPVERGGVKKKLSYLAYLLISATTPACAYAQDVPASAGSPSAKGTAEQADNTGDIIVTAQKRSERLRDVPVSITAVSGDQLAKQGITSVADLERIAPGFTYRLSQYGTPVFSIRGIGFYDEQVAVAPTVTIYTDQIPLVYARMTEGATLDVERVEVLKGPQGTLFGQNATGGAVNYIAAKPTDTFKAGFDATYGRFDQIDVGGYVSGPIASRLNARLAVRTEQRGNWQTNITRDAGAGQRDFLVGRLLLDWEPLDDLKISLNINGWRNKSDIQVTQARNYLPINPAPPTTPVTIANAAAFASYPYPKSNNPRPADWDPGLRLPRDDNFYQLAGRVDLAVLDSVNLIAITSYAHLKTLASVDLDGTNILGDTNIIHGKVSAFSQEVRLEGKSGSRLKWVIGGNYEQDRTNDFQEVFLGGSNSELGGIHFDSLNLLNHQRIRDIGGFGSLDYKLTDKLSVQASARYTDERRQFTGCLSDSGRPLGFRIVLGFLGIGPNQCITIGPNGPGLFQNSLNQHNTSWRGSLNWKPLNDTLLYANVTKGFKAGSFGTIPAVTTSQLAPVTQESVVAYEAGVKTSFADRAIDLNAAIFYYDYSDKQIQGFIAVAPFGNLPNLVNIPKSRLKGAEIEATLRPFDGLKLTVGATYLDSKVRGNAIVSSFFGNTVNAGGEAFPATPKWQVQSDAEYDFMMGGDRSAFLGASLSYRSDTVSGFGSRSGPPGTENFFAIPSYALLDLRAGVEFGKKYRVQIFGRNVTNTRYWTNVVHTYDTVARVTGMPVTYGITLTARY